MKIAILTHPLRVNYGGLLQAYALKKILEKDGHEVFHLQLESYKYKQPNSIIIYLKAITKYLLYYFTSNHKPFYTLLPISTQKMNILRRNIINFYKELNIKYYKTFDSSLNNEYDTFIVGSDQIWRPGFTPNIYNYYLDFIDKKNHKKIAYAASIGLDRWPYSMKESTIIKNLINEFDFASVRESSAKKLYKEYLSIDLPVVIDPTMLLTQQDYKTLFNNSPENSNYIAIYILNEEKEKEIISELQKFNCIELKNLMPRKRIKFRNEKITNNDIYESPGEWLKKIYNAKYIITDSFHGTVFSIIFNKQFIVLPNQIGGNSRIISLLTMLDLQYRYTNTINNIFEDDNLEIEYSIINKKIEILRKESLELLKSALNR